MLKPQKLLYEKTISKWFGQKVTLADDFDAICESDFDFIEILLLLEKKHSVDVLETEKGRQDFYKVEDFIDWVQSRPRLQIFNKMTMPGPVLQKVCTVI